MRRFIVGLDEGTTSVRAVLYDVDRNKITDKEGKKFQQYYPKSGWVEQDAEEIFTKLTSCVRAVLKRNEVKKEELLGFGITNQRETVVAWNRKTGKPIAKAIVWQCRRTTNMIKKLSPETKKLIQERTGLIANPYFSASKCTWIMENVKEAKLLAKEGNLCFGTIDSFLTFRLTGNFVTDTTNASRTCLMNISTLDWDDELLEIFKIPRHCLPKICSSDENFGAVKKFFGAPIVAIIGDQQSSMIGQGAIDIGDSKVTFGTGGFILTNISAENLEKQKNQQKLCEKCVKNAEKIEKSENFAKNVEISQKITSQKIENFSKENNPEDSQKLLLTVARTIGGKTEYAVEGSIYSACSAINWLQEIGMFEHVNQTSDMAKNLPDNGGVYFVPAFTGLGAPYWKDEARAGIFGMSFDTTKAHIVRACLESMAYNTKAVVDELKKDGHRLRKISVDGGGSNNEFLLQFLADMLAREVTKSKESEATVMGAIYVALLSLKLITRKEIKELTKSEKIYTPQISEKQRKLFYEGWQKAVKKV